MKPTSRDNLKERILNVSNLITPEILRNVTDTFYFCLGRCQVTEGHQFEHLIN